MSNVMLGVNNLIDSATIVASGGGGMVSTLPVTNFQKRQQGIVARTVNATLINYQITLPATQLVRVMGIFNHNLSLSATVRFNLYSDAGFTTLVYGSGSLPAFPNVYETGSATGWNDPTPGTPRVYTDYEKDLTKKDYIHVLPTAYEGRYWLIQFNDTSNPSGYTQAGRLFLGPGWTPTYNFNFGQNIGFEDTSEITEALDGSTYYREKPILRTANFTLACLNEMEAFQATYEIDRMCGITKEVCYIYDPADTYNILRRRFMGTMRKLSAIEQPEAYNNFSKTYEIKEVI